MVGGGWPVTGVGNTVMMSARHYGNYGLYMITYPLRMVTLGTGRIGGGKCAFTRRMLRSAYGNYTSYTAIYPSKYVAICGMGRRWVWRV